MEPDFIIIGVLVIALSGVAGYAAVLRWRLRRVVTLPQLNRMFEASPVGFCVLTMDRVAFASMEMQTVVGCHEGDSLLDYCRDKDDIKDLLQLIFEHKKNVASRVVDFRVLGGSGCYSFVVDACYWGRNWGGQDTAVVWISEMENATKAQGAIYLSRHDPLTDCLNRRGFNEQLSSEIERVVRIHGHTFSLVMADIDLFKNINDTYGHLCGDYVLLELTRLFHSNIRAYDAVCRWGGEEFFLMLPSTVGSDALHFAERMRKRVEEHLFNWEGHALRLTVSLGVQEYDAGMSTDDLIAAVDKKLYQAKRNGRNQVAG